MKFAFDRTQIENDASHIYIYTGMYIYIYNFCVKVFKKTMSCTEMIEYSFKANLIEYAIGYVKN